MILSAIFLAMGCPAPVITNTSKYVWNRIDKDAVDIAQRRCESDYPNSPCLVTFTKTGEYDYQAECGKKE